MSDTYQKLDQSFVVGSWRKASGDTIANICPWDETTIFEVASTTEDDVDEACKAAQKAQREWGAMPPAARAAKMHAIADILEARKDEIAGWILREAGGTKLKAALELMLVTQVARSEAATLPYMVKGAIMPEDIPGKESRAYRQPAGVIALISPWNFPLQLTARTLFPALALGNGVVIKPASDTIVTGGTIFAAITTSRRLALRPSLGPLPPSLSLGCLVSARVRAWLSLSHMAHTARHTRPHHRK